MKIIIACILTILMHMYTAGQLYAQCTINSGPVYFGNIENPVASFPLTGSTITVTCDSGDVYTIEIDKGQNYAIQNLTRNLNGNGGNYLSYVLKQASGTIWGDGVYGSVLEGTGTGSPVTHVVSGEILETGSLNIGSYSDVVVATVTWNGGSEPWPSVTVPVTGVVEGSCSVSASGVNFGQIRLPVSSLPQAEGGLTVNCSSLLVYKIELDPGNYYMHPLRRMKWEKGEAYLGYSLYKDSSCMEDWLPDDAGATVSSGTGVPQYHVICGRAWPMGSEPIGMYRDDVIARISW